MAGPKHFLDTSVLFPVLTGSARYKAYFEKSMDQGGLYVSPYVLMEFKRSFLSTVVHFYFTLDLPNLSTVGDAFSLWSNRFKTRETKAALRLAGALIDMHRRDPSLSRDKKQTQLALARYVRRLETKLRHGFNNVSQDTARCERAKVGLRIRPAHASADLRQFLDAFDDVETCRGRCRIHDFVLNRFRSEVQGYVRQAEDLPDNSDTSGFRKIAENLAEILERGPETCSCVRCERIGDAVVALDAPRDMRLEHTDKSFNYLCPPINQPHQQHPSETAVICRKPMN